MSELQAKKGTLAKHCTPEVFSAPARSFHGDMQAATAAAQSEAVSAAMELWQWQKFTPMLTLW